MFVDASHVFFADQGGVSRATSDGATVDELADFSDVWDMTDIDDDGAHLYVATGPSVQRVAADGTATTSPPAPTSSSSPSTITTSTSDLEAGTIQKACK